MKQLDKVEIGRMRQLADFLETVPPSKFDLSQWEVEAYVPAKTFLFGLIHWKDECGFAGCAMGWAAFSELFPGLSLMKQYEDDWHYTTVLYRGFTDYRAVAFLFGISERAATYFFAPNSCKIKPEPGDVAARLNRFADKVENRLKRYHYKENKTITEYLRLVA